ncbi:MMPL family transporter, partial [Janibacter melonis]|uniref:MMPL family transporter n=1 Tax=Janibacter melonis TaxID=262209 RepID=UPI00177A7B0F|nr:MMPL family transporter [Janibacter melonis]
ISGVTVVVAMAGMLVAGGLFSSLAVGTIVVVALAVVFSATVLPALLAVLGDRVDALRLPFARRREARRAAGRSVWGRVAGVATRRPLAWAAVVTALLVALAAPALGMKTALGGVETLPQDLPVVAATHQLERAIPSDGTAVQVVVRAPAGSEAEVARALEASSGDLAALPHVSGVAPQPQVSGDGTVSVLDVGVGMSASDERLPAVVAQVRDEADDIRADLADVPGAQVHVGGQAASTDLTQWMDSRLPWVVGFVLALTFVVMALSFGSLWLAAATIGLNLLSVGAAYGVMTAIFSGTWAESVLDFDSTGAIAAWLPLLMFVVLFGLSMDYHVFVTSRVREARLAGSSPREAVSLGVARSAGVVTSAAAVMIGVFSIFATLSVLDMKQLGVGLAVAILLDATVVRALLLPAVLALLGDRAHRGPQWLPAFHH